ncbi:MAG: HAMP domain-containing histidine kinase [Chitinispirillaceae bacterium]|nr:HAMP domain-containing histidine kinase [Chitinispirillaceae bacterium]
MNSKDEEGGQEKLYVGDLPLIKGYLHDINNFFTSIICSTGAAGLCESNSEELSEWLVIIRTTAMKAAELTSMMMRLCHPEAVAAKTTCELRSIVTTAVKICSGRRIGGITVRHSELPCAIKANETALVSVLVNLLMNALNATSESQGEISIEYGTVADQSGSETEERKNSAVVVIEDNGAGMSDVFLDKITNNNYHSAESDHGIGIQMVQHIVKQHRGTIEILSGVGSGTSVTLRFPSAE